ncbi:MAG: HAMP domain-containing protein [Comamonadaceae bacterium]|nr:MAG: HAMP domain-containing protein [Comamonadaceae bacterium]
MKRPASLQGRLILLVSGTAAAVWLATALLTWTDARHELDELLDSHLAQAAALLVAQQDLEFDDDEVQDAPALHRYAPRVAFQVFHEGRLALRSASAPAAPLVQGGRTAEGFHTVQVGDQRWRVFAARGAERDVLVFVGEDLRARESILVAVLRSAFWPVAVALPLLALAGWWAVRRGLAPLRSLGATLAARRPGELQPVELAAAPTEMRSLLDALNALFARIASLLEGERRFTADAAHELRTPIAAIRAQAQAALATNEAAAREHALHLLLQGCDRAARLVQQLLTLSRLEADGRQAQARVDLAGVVRAVLADLAPAALARQQALDFEAAGECSVMGDATLLGVLVRNLADNAIRYSPAGARIAVRVHREAGQVLLQVHDSGPGLPDADLQRLGERFFRVTGNEAAGSGLGWSIAQRIAAAHGGTLEATRSESLGGLRVTASLPA